MPVPLSRVSARSTHSARRFAGQCVEQLVHFLRVLGQRLVLVLVHHLEVEPEQPDLVLQLLQFLFRRELVDGPCSVAR